jgi:nucleoside-diphosphate-sugar epimerase
VTGVGGFVGAAVARECLRQQWDVTAIYRRRMPSRLPAHPRLTLIGTDLRRCEGLPGNYDCLVHSAADVPATCPDPDELFNSNVEGTRRILGHAAQAGAQRVVYMSSMAVYGAISAPVVNEQTTAASPGLYGKSKAAGEDLLREWADRAGGRGIAIRLPGVVGAGGRNNFLCDTLQRILGGGSISARNPEAMFNNVLHVDDLARFVVAALPQLAPGATPLTLAAIEPLSIRAVLSRLFRGARRETKVEWASGGGTPFLIAFERAVALGYRPATVADSIDRFVGDVLQDQLRA